MFIGTHCSICTTYVQKDITPPGPGTRLSEPCRLRGNNKRRIKNEKMWSCFSLQLLFFWNQFKNILFNKYNRYETYVYYLFYFYLQYTWAKYSKTYIRDSSPYPVSNCTNIFFLMIFGLNIFADKYRIIAKYVEMRNI